MSEWIDTRPPTLIDIEHLALSARDRLPPPFRQTAQEVLLRVEDLAPADLLADLEMAEPYALTGLYDGIPLTEKSVMDQPHGPDVIWLFRLAILDEWLARGDIALGHLVAHVYVHELAHHLGWSDADIAAIDRWWE